MARTHHHNSHKKAKLPKFNDHYTGWFGEGCWKQRGRKFIKRLVNRANRRWRNENA